MGLEASPAVRTELLAVAFALGTRSFPRAVLERLFREELQMLKEASFIEEWIQQGKIEGEVQGRAAEARQLLLRLLRARFGELPDAVVARVGTEGPEWCEEMAVRTLHAASLEELGF